MNAGQQTARRLAARAGRPVCRSCRSRNTYATAAAASAPVEAPIQQAHQAQHTPPVTVAAPSYAINAGVVLSRPPLITRDLHPLEAAFFLYQRRLNERLALPFARYFYFKKKTPADLEWKRKIKQRLTPARDIGRYEGYGEESWNDELLINAPESEIAWQVEQLLQDAEKTGAEGEGAGENSNVPSTETTEAGEKSSTATPVQQGSARKVEHEPIERPMPRITEADEKGDLKSLNRALQRTLYLLVKDREGRWMFPQDKIIGKENLHLAAERILVQSSGLNMNTWIVGNVPIGHHEHNFLPGAAKPVDSTDIGYKTFFMKARIMAGQANLTDNKLGLADFKWLSREEMEKVVEKKYWHSIKNMLAER
ncbi:50S ribosomal subunit L30 [Amniculicola lignicola CBS 123094]|uniref:Large ribosomal subunit protein mL46 n=1 Tax=Amniculicola lignicola CBS 123094 TaxID=1392246 RepID=A0A6A5WKW3_9PLEO|nr:50S ribosomal subunit L30 [Amniculicola lignicola CBS 123094]